MNKPVRFNILMNNMKKFIPFPKHGGSRKNLVEEEKEEEKKEEEIERKKEILIIDDDIFSSKVLASLLQKESYKLKVEFLLNRVN
jgi:PleD family two-component response regulator